MGATNSTSIIDRRKDILFRINSTGQVLIPELANQFKVSEVTIRNDLKQLEKKKLLLRARGGGIKIEHNVGIDYHLSEKDKLHSAEKAIIGKKAVEMIKENETIILDSGTTTMEIAKNIGHLENITVISNALNIIEVLHQLKNVDLIIPGGHLRKNSLSLVGPISEKSIRNLYVDKVFIGVDGFDSRVGIYTPNIEEAHLNEIMINVAREVVVVCDSSKFSRRSFGFICGVSKIHYVITDARIPDEDRMRLEDEGIKVIIA